MAKQEAKSILIEEAILITDQSADAQAAAVRRAIEARDRGDDPERVS